MAAKDTPSHPNREAPGRAERLAQSLKANLARRKAAKPPKPPKTEADDQT